MVAASPAPHIAVQDLTIQYGASRALEGITLEIPRHTVFGVIGPARSGKSTLLKCVNRMIDVAGGRRIRGRLLVDGADVFAVRNLHDLRRRVGMVLPLPVALPLTVYDNVAFAPRMSGLSDRRDLDALVEECLRQAALWDEVKDRLHGLGTTLSGGQQQRLALARALSHRPDVLCLDEFSIAVDPVTTMRIEDVLLELAQRLTIVVATNLVQQAHRLAANIAFLHAGRLVEAGPTARIFSGMPASATTRDYVMGRFG
jgi:phosphate transport system ATP-binding protein